jgi:hypothetical protein
MDAKPRSLKDIFDAQCRYMVPLYQRPYVWTEQDQWEPLWEDIAALADRYYRADPYRPHFMGAVVLEQLNTATGTLDLRQIIDGQQRLTTLQIVIEAACDVCDAYGAIAANNARDLRRLTRNDPRDGDPDEVFKVWPTNVDREHFQLVMSATCPDEVRQHYDGKSNGDVGFAIANGYLFFYNKISEWLAAAGPDQIKKKLDALQNALYRGLLLVVIDLDEKDDAQMIFETLNARGTPLLASDLVKNYLLHRAEDYGHNLDQLYHQHWLYFDSTPFWREKAKTGRMLRPQIELFLQYYVTILTRDEVLVTNLFNTFRQYVKKHPEIDPATYMADLHRYGQLYQQFFTYSPEKPEGLFFRRMQALDITTIMPLLLIVFDKLNKPEHEKQRRSILTDLESFLVRRMVCELGTKNYNNLFLEAVKQFTDCDPAQLGSAIRECLKTQTIDISRWPNDEEFLEAWQKIEAYKRFKPQIRLHMILEALELQRRASNKTEDVSLPKKKLSIEHIMPRGWTEENWPLPAGIDDAKEARERLIHTLGNLTLVTGSLNSTLSNDPWEKKIVTLNKHSVLLLNADLKSEKNWDETAIKNRSKDLFKLAKNIWPYPAASSH